jgi:hypothetical protein
VTAPEGAVLGAGNGVFAWRPVLAQANTTNPVAIKVADNGFPILSATQLFNIEVISPVLPSLGTPQWVDGNFGFAVSGDPGPDYTVLSSSNLIDWAALFTTNSPSMPLWFADPEAHNREHRFYRVLLGP